MSWLGLFKTGSASRSATRAFPQGERAYAIGDIHGCHDHLRRLLDAIRQDVEARPVDRVTLVYLGDYVDRGPNPKDTLTLAGSDLPWVGETVRLRGNHEEMMLRFLAEPAFGQAWRQYGGLTTLASYGVDVRAVQVGREFDTAARRLAEALPEGHRQLLANLPASHTIGDYFFCHAGVRPGVPLDRQDPYDLCWIRDEFLSCEEDHGKVIVHGHSPVDAVAILRHRINVDTGAYATHKLSAVAIDAAGPRAISVGHGA